MSSANRLLAPSRHVGGVGVFILCVNLWRYSHLMRSSILTLWGHGQSKSLFLQPSHSHVMRKPTQSGKITRGGGYPSPHGLLENKGFIAPFAPKFLQAKVLTGKIL